MSDSSPVRSDSACRRRERRHLARQEACRQVGVQALACADSLKAGLRQRSGSRWQQPRRDLERQARRRSVAFARWARRRGLQPEQVAAALRLAPRTLRHWNRQWQDHRLQAPPRGRPAARSSRAGRSAVLELLHTAGPCVPLDVLRAQFPQMSRAELKRLLRRYRRECRRQREARPRRLYWSCPGSVWAMDFVEHLGGLSWVYSVRDLASRRQLLWLSVPSPNAAVVIAALEKLFGEHGPPLVLKSDNGSGFIAAETIQFLRRHGVVPLFSPPRRPQYNGGCERGGSILKGYTYQVALRDGRPGLCRPADLEQARQLANALSRPWGHRGPSPEEVWSTRGTLSLEQRQQFEVELALARRVACEQLEYAPDQALSRNEGARRDRRAVQAVLETLGYLKIVPRRDPLLRRVPTSLLDPESECALTGELHSAVLPAPLAEEPCILATEADNDVGLSNLACDRSTHGESTLIRVLRRSITPLLNIFTTANIP